MSNERAPRGRTRRGVMLVISSPSGAGKTTLARRLLEGDPGITLSVSVTTRRPRAGETDGVDYHFIDEPRFDRLIAEGALLEWATVFANRYGTPKAEIEDALAAGRDILFDIDWQGARQIRERAGGDAASVFILPPSGEVLARRLRGRALDDGKVVAARLAAAAGEISHWGEYDYVIVNDDLEASARTLGAILAAERHKRARQEGPIAALAADLIRELEA